MTDSLELALKVKADVKAAIKQLDRLEKEIKQQGDASDKAATKNRKNSRSLADLAKNAKSSERAIGNQVTLFRNAAAALGVYAAVAKTIQAIRIADDFRQIEARVRRLTDTQSEFNEVWGDLVEISNNNGQAIRTTVSLFEGINRAGPELNATRDQVLAVTNAVQQLGALSGATGEQMGNSMLQFSQAMAGGIVRAEEFNSIVENTPAIAEAIAKGMGLTVGEMRKAVIEGRVLSKDVFAALLKQAPEVAKAFKDAPTSIERASQALSNNIGRMIRELDKASGISAGVAFSLRGWGELAGRAADSLAELNKENAPRIEAEEALNELFDKRLDLVQRLQPLESKERPGLLDKKIMRDLRDEITAVDEQMRRLTERRDELLKEGAARAPVLGSGADEPAGDGVPNTLAAAIGKQEQANNKIQSLVERRQTLIDQLDALSAKLSGPASIDEEASDASNIFTLNRLRGSAQTKLEAGDLDGAFADLERAKGIIESLQSSGAATGSYLQRQVELVRKLASDAADYEIKVPVTLDDNAAHVAAQEFGKIVSEFERQNPGVKFGAEFDEPAVAAQLQRSLAAMQQIANQSKITVPGEIVFQGQGERFSISLDGKQLDAVATSDSADLLGALRNARAAENER